MGRLRRVGVVVAGVTLAFSCMNASAVASGGDWPQERYSAAGNSFNPSESTVSVSNVASLHSAWVRGFSTAKFVGVPVVSGGHLFSVISGGVISIKAATGKTRWRIQLAGANSARIGVANAVVYVTTPNGLYALDASTGAGLWELPGAFAGAPVVISNGTVYTGRTTLHAVDASTGRERWHFDMGWDDPYPVVANGVVYARQTDQLVALDANTGDVLWAVPEELPILLYRTSLYALWGLHSVDPSTGTQKWWNQDVGYPVVAANGRVYAHRTSIEGWAAVNAGTGNILWTRPVALQSAALANGVIYALEGKAGGGGTIRAIDADTGAELATLPGHAGPVISHGTVYVVDNHVFDDGVPTLYALKP